MKKTTPIVRRFAHLDCISGCALNWCCRACGGCWHGVWGRAGACCWGTPSWPWAGGPAGWAGWCWGCCCCCLYRDRLKNRPRMAFRFPFLISARQSWEVSHQWVFSLHARSTVWTEFLWHILQGNFLPAHLIGITVDCQWAPRRNK